MSDGMLHCAITMKFIKNYSLSIVLFLLFFVSWIGQGYYQWAEYVDNQKTHQQEIRVEEYMNEFTRATLENWQSEFLQLFTFVVLTTFLIHKGSHESKDSDEKMQQALSRIEAKIGINKTSKRGKRK